MVLTDSSMPRRLLANNVLRLSRNSRNMATSSGPAIALTPQEDEFVTLLDRFTASLREQRPELAPLQLRIAGGWVRDKVWIETCCIVSVCGSIDCLQLLGLPSDDLDVSTSHLTGLAFAELLSQSRQAGVGNVARIAANPNQSKHLETAKAQVGAFEVDFVQLRSEEYAQDSRIPEIVSFLVAVLPFQRLGYAG
jgi:tRNA nucleotidyltransferase (CCA-adding enzyme)